MSEMNRGQSSPAESMMQDPDIQNGLRAAFAELDNFYDGIRNQTQYDRHVYPTSITPDGTFIEASRIALPQPQHKKDGYLDESHTTLIRAYHDSVEYVLFKFELAEIADPHFQLKPLPIKNVQDHRGGGIDITIDNPDDPEPLFPDFLSAEAISLTDEQFDAIDADRKAWRQRNVVHLPQMADDQVRLGDTVAEPFKEVRERAGVTI